MEICLAIKRAEIDRFMSQPGPLDFAWYLRQAGRLLSRGRPLRKQQQQ